MTIIFSAHILGQACRFKQGDGLGSKEEYVGRMSRENCVAYCFNKQKTEPTITGVTVDAKGGNYCYCEYNMNGRNTQTARGRSFQSCYLESKLQSLLNS